MQNERKDEAIKNAIKQLENAKQLLLQLLVEEHGGATAFDDPQDDPSVPKDPPPDQPPG